MSVQLVAKPKPLPAPKGCGYYLMELRQHAVQTNARREKLLINDWAAPQIQFVPILQRPSGIGPS